MTAPRLPITVLLVSSLLAACKSSEPAKESPAAASTPSQEPAATAQATHAKPDKAKPDKAESDKTEAAPAPAPQDTGKPSNPLASRPDIEQFQAVLMPFWGSEPGAVRGKRACDGYATLLKHVNAIDKHSPPTGVDGEAWRLAVDMVQIHIDDMGPYCDDGEPQGADEMLASAHKELQELIALIPR